MAIFPRRSTDPAAPARELAGVPRIAAIELDLRALPIPEPLERALAAADALPPGGTLSVLTPWMPAPLLQALAERGMQIGVEPLARNGARVWIRRPGPHGAAGD